MSSPSSTPADPMPDAGAPPAEVLDAITVAAAVYEQMATEGREVRFELDHSGKVHAQLRDLSGLTLAQLSAGDVIDLAAGGSLR